MYMKKYCFYLSIYKSVHPNKKSLNIFETNSFNLYKTKCVYPPSPLRDVSQRKRFRAHMMPDARVTGVQLTDGHSIPTSRIRPGDGGKTALGIKYQHLL